MPPPMRLTWGGTHFLLRYANATLSLRALRVDGGSKVASVAPLTALPVRAERLEPLPTAARLVAAAEVSDSLLGLRTPIVVFQASVSLYLFALTKTPDASLALQFINRVDVAATGFTAAQNNGVKVPDLQVRVVDGPYVTVHQAASQELSILALHRRDARFFVWRSGIKTSETPQLAGLRTCVLVDEDASDKPHLLLHFDTASEELGGESSGHWMVYRLSESSDESDALERCVYIFREPSLVADSATSSDEHVSCCALLRQDDDAWRLGYHPLGAWTQQYQAPPTTQMLSRSSAGVRHDTLVVTGTTRNTIYVHSCGVLMVSCVLPSTPCEIVQVDGGDNDLLFLAVQCSDVNRSFFLLSFSPSALQPTMTIVQAFSHVGGALIGDFTMQSAADELLLINDVEDAEDGAIDDLLFVTKSVLICKKHSSEKHSIHRLRADEPVSKEKIRGQKRGRDSRVKVNAPASLRFIERIKLGTKQRAAGRHDDDPVAAGAASGAIKLAVAHDHLVHLTSSLEKRLENGIHELDRLKLIVASKRDMIQRLDSFVTDEWWRSQESGDAGTEGIPFRPQHRGEVEIVASTPELKMQTLIPGPNADRVEPLQPSRLFSLKPLVTLSSFRVVEFVPAMSLFRIEVVLKNESARSLHNAFVALVSDSAGGCTSSDALESSSSVQASMQFATQNGSGLSSFSLEVKLPPSFRILRSSKVVQTAVWLHCCTRGHLIHGHHMNSGGHGALVPSHMNLNWDCSLLVSSVKIDLHKAVVSHTAPNRRQEPSSSSREMENLLVLSSGSSLTQLFQPQPDLARSAEHKRSLLGLMQAQKVLVPELVRPMFALAHLAINDRELSKYHLSHLHSSLPRDVYTMLNPLTKTHLFKLVSLLTAIRGELMVLQRRSMAASRASQSEVVMTTSSEDGGEDSTSETSGSSQQWQLLTDFRRMQKETDLQAAGLLHDLQKRANFHSMWHTT